MLVTQDKSNLFGGVSQQAPASRTQHQVKEMINCIPTIESGLRVRNPSLPIRLYDGDGNLSEPTFPAEANEVFVYEFDKGSVKAQNNKFAYLITAEGGLEIIDLNFDISEDEEGRKVLSGRIYRDGQGINYASNSARDYLTYVAGKSNFAMTTVKDAVFVTNKSVSPTMNSVPKTIMYNDKAGTRAASGFVYLDYNGVTSGDSSTITGANGNFVFSRPPRVYNVEVCYSGGGGGGGAVKGDAAVMEGVEPKATFTWTAINNLSYANNPTQNWTLVTGSPYNVTIKCPCGTQKTIAIGTTEVLCGVNVSVITIHEDSVDVTIPAGSCSTSSAYTGSTGGGGAGKVVNGLIKVGDEEAVSVGIGGIGGSTSSNGGYDSGGDGGSSKFGSFGTALGGVGGTARWEATPTASVYAGVGNPQASCGGNSNDGVHVIAEDNGVDYRCYGGESNGFGRGGAGDILDTSRLKADIWQGNDGFGAAGGGGAAKNTTEAGSVVGGNGGSGIMRISWTEGVPPDPNDPVRNPLLYERRGFIWIKQADPELGFKYGAIITILKQDGNIDFIQIPFTEALPDETMIIAGYLAEAIALELGDRARVTYENSIVEIFLVSQDSFGNTASYGWAHKADFITDLPKSMGSLTGIVEVGVEGSPSIWVEYRGGAWLEHRDPRMTTTLMAETMPHVINRRYNESTSEYEFYVEQYEWNERLIGDFQTNALPSFIGKYIKDIFFFRNRLGFITENAVCLSEVGYYGNFFRTTVAAVLDSDRIDAGVESTKSINLEYAILLDDSVILFSDKAQFRFRGGNILSPSNYQINQELAYDINMDVRPLFMNNRIFFITRRGVNSAIYEMFVSNQSNQNSIAKDLTIACKTYVDGLVDKLTGSAVNQMLFVTSRANYSFGDDVKNLNRRFMFMYKFHDIGNERVQSAWSKWQFNGDIISGFALGTSFYTMMDRINTITPATWILSSGSWVMSAAWLMDKGSWIMSDDSLKRQKQFEWIALQPKPEGEQFLDNYNTPVEAYVNLDRWVYGTDGKRSPRGELQFRTVEIDASDTSEVAVIIENRQRVSTRFIEAKHVKGRKPMVMGNAKHMGIGIMNGEAQGFRIEVVSFEGTITKRARST